MASGAGAWLRDVDGNEYVDLICSWGPLLLGHAHPEVQAAVVEAVSRGTSYGTPTRPEVELAEEIVHRTSVEQVRFVSSGTEATMSAIRLARGFTGRDLVVKFAGCYHGHVDSLLAEAGSGLATHRVEGSVPGTPGVPAGSTAATLVLPYNDREAVEAAFAAHGPEIACLITEASPGNMGVVPPLPGFNQFLVRDLREAWRAVRLRRGDDRVPGLAPRSVGARRGRRGLDSRPGHLRQGDGRWLPGCGVRGPGRRDGDAVARTGRSTRQARSRGTRSRPPPVWPRCGWRPRRSTRTSTASASTLSAAVGEELSRAGVPHVVQAGGNMFSVFLGLEGDSVRDFAAASRQDTAAYKAFFHAMLDQGVYLPPSAYEAWFLSAAHDDRALQQVLDALPAAAEAAGGSDAPQPEPGMGSVEQ